MLQKLKHCRVLVYFRGKKSRKAAYVEKQKMEKQKGWAF
jgi:hypothetical protein